MLNETNPEIVLAFVVVVLSAVGARFGHRRLVWWPQPFAALARRKTLAIVVAGAAPLIVRAALIPWFPAPQPRVHDEFTILRGGVEALGSSQVCLDCLI